MVREHIFLFVCVCVSGGCGLVSKWRFRYGGQRLSVLTFFHVWNRVSHCSSLCVPGQLAWAYRNHPTCVAGSLFCHHMHKSFWLSVVLGVSGPHVFKGSSLSLESCSQSHISYWYTLLEIWKIRFHLFCVHVCGDRGMHVVITGQFVGVVSCSFSAANRMHHRAMYSQEKIFFTYLDVRKPKLKGMAPGSDICTASLFARKSKAKTGRDNGMRLNSAFYKKLLEVVMMWIHSWRLYFHEFHSSR